MTNKLFVKGQVVSDLDFMGQIVSVAIIGKIAQKVPQVIHK
jgi:hypothetical protein